jgi:F-box and leucine-rich repeat protein 10/11
MLTLSYRKAVLTQKQRRCIHDENGNVDPIKAAEAPIPRGSASKKRRVSDVEDGEALSKRMRLESFAGLVHGPVSHFNRYPLQKPRAASATGSPEDMAIDAGFGVKGQSYPEDTMRIDPQLYGAGGDESEAAALPRTIPHETVISSIEENSGEPMECVVEAQPTETHTPNHDPRTPPPHADTLAYERNGIHAVNSPSEVSPAKSVRHAPPASMTPEWSRSSKVSARSWNGKSTTPKTTPGGKNRRDSKDGIKMEPKSDQKPRPVPTVGGKKKKKNEDMASIALALQLQMEEHGLRRRSK